MCLLMTLRADFRYDFPRAIVFKGTYGSLANIAEQGERLKIPRDDDAAANAEGAANQNKLSCFLFFNLHTVNLRCFIAFVFFVLYLFVGIFNSLLVQIA